MPKKTSSEKNQFSASHTFLNQPHPAATANNDAPPYPECISAALQRTGLNLLHISLWCVIKEETTETGRVGSQHCILGRDGVDSPCVCVDFGSADERRLFFVFQDSFTAKLCRTCRIIMNSDRKRSLKPPHIKSEKDFCPEAVAPSTHRVSLTDRGGP